MKKLKDQEFQKLLEEKYGANFTINLSTMVEFINELLDDGYSEDSVYFSILVLYRDDFIDYYNLKALFDKVGFTLPNEFSFHSEDAKKILRDTALLVNDDIELVNYLYYYYQTYKIDFNVFEIACLFLGYHMNDEFLKLDDEERRNQIWFNDKDDKKVVLSDIHAKLFKNITSYQYIKTSELLIPSIKYEYPMDFAFDYMKQYNISDKVLVKHGLDRRKKAGMARKEKLKKIEIFRLIFCLNMSLSIAKQFLTLAGYTFSPLNPQDCFFYDYLNGKYNKVNTLEELDELAKINKVELEYEFKYPFWK